MTREIDSVFQKPPIARSIRRPLIHLVAATAACSAGPTITPVVPTALTVTVSAPTVTVGATLAAKATVLAGSQPISSAGVSWSSSDATVATVSADGTVTGITRGTAQIRATLGPLSASMPISVIGVRSIGLSAPPALLPVGRTVTLSATVDADPGVSTVPTWSSSAPGVATVSAAGLVMGVAQGSATIVAAVGGQTATADVRVVTLQLSIQPASTLLAVGDTVRFSASLAPITDDALMRGLTWRVNDTTKAVMTSPGVLVAKAAGSLIVTAETGGASATATTQIGLNYRGRPLSGSNFTERDLTYADFSSAVLIGAQFYRANAYGARFRSANLTLTDLRAANLRAADLTNVVLTDAKFSIGTTWPDGFNPAGRGMWGPGLDYSGMSFVSRNFHEMDFTGARFIDATLSGTHLNLAGFVAADLTRANLSDASLFSTVFTGANLTDVTWTRARFSRATVWPAGFSPSGKGMWGPFQDYSGQSFAGRNFYGYDFLGCRMRGTDLSGANLAAAGFEQVDFTNANLRNADLSGASLEGATLTGAVLTGATYTANTVWPRGFDPVAAGAVRR
jgi:uncharacterized protein YjbI with pentapeptide repeats